MKINRLGKFALAFAAGIALAAPAVAVERAPLPHVDMHRMYGGWYMIATLPNSFEKGMVAPFDVYSKRPDGDIQEDFFFQGGGFSAPRKHSNNASWRVQVFWPINLPFLVLWTDPDYRYVIFGEDDRQLGWIFSRTRDIPDADYQALLARFDALGYDSKKLVKFIHTPDQIGKPGYWSDGVK